MVCCKNEVWGINDSAGWHAATCIHQDRRFARFFGSIRQGIRKFYQYILAH
jgi:hypothetical protein